MSDYDEIRQLQLAYAERVDKGDGDSFAELFTPQGVLIVSRGNEFRGHETLSAVVKSMPPGGFHSAGEITEIRIAGDVAIGGCAYEARRAGEIVLGHYEDKYLRTAEGWRIEFRKAVAENITPLYEV